jgi:hypothetical protein
MKKLTMPGLAQYLAKPSKTGIILVRYLTEIMDAGMPMQALLSSMPMPSYAHSNQSLQPPHSFHLLTKHTQRPKHAAVPTYLSKLNQI